MELTSLVKVIAAFIAGVVVALGSALILVRMNEAVQPRSMHEATPVVQPTPGSQASAQPLDQGPAEQESAEPVRAPAPAQNVEPKKFKPLMDSLATHRHTTPPRASASGDSVSSPVEIARNVPVRGRQDQERGPSIPGVNSDHPSSPEGNSSSTGGYPSLSNPEGAPESQTAQPYQPISARNPPPVIEPSSQPHVVTLQPGTNLAIRLGETLSTDHNYTGDTFRATLESPIIMNGFVIADKGSKVLGRLVNAERAGHFEGVADLNLILTEIHTTDGQRVQIDTTSYDKRGPAYSGVNTAKIAGGAALGAIIGGVAGGGKGAAIGAGAGGAAGTGAVFASRGKPAVLPTETLLTFHLAAPVTITEKLNN